jgi:hypothetical protein
MKLDSLHSSALCSALSYFSNSTVVNQQKKKKYSAEEKESDQ